MFRELRMRMKVVQGFSLLFVCTLAALAFAFVAGASAATHDVDRVDFIYNLHNESDACAWVTVYWSYKAEAGWHIEHGGGAEPKFVDAGGYTRGNVVFNNGPMGPQVRIRAEMKSGGAKKCEGGTFSDVETKYNIAYGEKRPFMWTVTIEGSKSKGYRVVVSG